MKHTKKILELKFQVQLKFKRLFDTILTWYWQQHDHVHDFDIYDQVKLPSWEPMELFIVKCLKCGKKAYEKHVYFKGIEVADNLY